MGRSFVSFEGYTFSAPDAVLQFWLYLLVREIEQEDDQADWLKELREYWTMLYPSVCPGCISPGLDRSITSEAQRKKLVSISESAYQALIDRGEVITRDELNSAGIRGAEAGTVTAFQRDLPIVDFAEAGRLFIKLLKGDVEGEERIRKRHQSDRSE